MADVKFRLAVEGGAVAESVVNSFSKSLGKVGEVSFTAQDTLSSLTEKVLKLTGALVGIGSVVEFADMIHSSIDAAEKLVNLSKSTNIAIEDLAGLRLLARETGTDLDGLAKGINKMSVEMGKDPEKFRLLGITAKDNKEAFKQFADIFNLLPDIQQRNALAMKVFGKSWAEMAPALSEGGTKIGEIIDKGAKLSGVTTEMAKQSKEFNDKWAELTTTGGMLTRIVGGMLPSLNGLADDLISVQQNGQGASGVFQKIGESIGTGLVFVKDSTVFLYEHKTAVEAVAGAYLSWKIGTFVAGMAESAVATYASITANMAAKAALLETAVANAAATGATVTLTTARVAELRVAVAAAEGEVALAIATNGLIPMQASAAAAALAHADATAALAVAQRSASVSAGLASGALGLLGGPIGVITVLLGLGATAWAIWGKSTKDAIDTAEENVARGLAVISRLQKEAKFGRGDAGLLNEGLASAKLILEQETASFTAAQDLVRSNTHASAAAMAKDLADVSKAYSGALAADQANVAKYEQQIKSSTDATAAQAEATKKEAAATKEAAAAATAHAKAFLEKDAGVKEQDAAFKQYVGTLKTLENQLGKLEGQSESEKLGFELYGRQVTLADGSVVHFTGSLEKMMLAKDAGKWAENLKMWAAEVDLRKQIQDVLKAETTYREALDKVLLAGQAITTGAITAGKDQIDQYKFETGLIGKTAEQLLVLNAERKIDLDYKQQLKALGDVYTEGGAGLDAEIVKLDAATKALREGLIPEMINRREIERAWATGSKAAYDEYVDNATNASRQSKELFSAMYKGMEDDAFNFFRHGELSATNFVNAIKDQLARLAAQKFTVWVTGEVGLGGSGGSTGSSAGGLLNGASSAYNLSGALSGYSSGIATGASWLGAGGTAGSSAAALGYGNAVGAVGGDGLGAMIAGNGGWAGVSTMGSAGTGAAALGAGEGAAASGVTGALGAIPVYGWIALAAIAAYEVFHKNFISAQSTGDASISYNATGQQIGSKTIDGTNSYTNGVIQGLQSGYASAAASLGIGTVGTQFGYGSNTGREGSNPNFTMSASAGGSSYKSLTNDPSLFGANEMGITLDNLKLASSQAILTALQGSELPKYLAGVFDGLSAGTMTQTQVDTAMAAAQSFKLLRDQLQQLPFEYLKDMSYSAAKSLTDAAGGMDKLGTALGTYYDKFYSADEKTALLTKNTTDAFAALGIVMPQVNDSTRAWYRSEVDRLGALDLGVAANASAYTAALNLASAVDTLAPVATAAKSTLDAASSSMQSFTDNVMGLVAGIHASVTDSSFAMAYGLQDNAGKYAMLDSQAAGYDAAMKAATNINVIAKNAQLEIDTINKAWSVLDTTQQGATLKQYQVDLLKVDSFVTQSGADALSIKKADNAALSEAVATAVAKAQEDLIARVVAATLAQAAATAQQAAATASIEQVVRMPVQLNVTKANGTEVSIS